MTSCLLKGKHMYSQAILLALTSSLTKQMQTSKYRRNHKAANVSCAWIKTIIYFELFGEVPNFLAGSSLNLTLALTNTSLAYITHRSLCGRVFMTIDVIYDVHLNFWPAQATRKLPWRSVYNCQCGFRK